MNQDSLLSQKLAEVIPSSCIFTQEPLARHTTFRIGGPAEVLVMPTTQEQIIEVVRFAAEQDVALRVLGLGSDLLVSDSGVGGITLKLAENFSAITPDGSKIRVQAGATNAAVAQTALAHSLAGYEFASGIPGTVGGAAIMNAGAYGGEFRDVATRLVCLTKEGHVVELRSYEAQWGYRRSVMDREGMVVLEAELQLRPDDPSDIRDRMEDLRERRESKQPLEMPSAGSTFKRPVGYFAGKLIQDAELRGFTIGGAQVSQKHTGFIVNTGTATAEDVRALIVAVQERVYDRFGVSLHPEVRFWGFDDNVD